MAILSVTAETHARLTVMLWSVDTEVIAIKASVLYLSNPTIPADRQHLLSPQTSILIFQFQLLLFAEEMELIRRLFGYWSCELEYSLLLPVFPTVLFQQ